MLSNQFLQDIFVKLLKDSRSLRRPIVFTDDLQKFMLSSKESFDYVLRVFSTATEINIDDSGVNAAVIIDKKYYYMNIQANEWFFKPLSTAMVSSSVFKDLNVHSISGLNNKNMVSMVRTINGELKQLQIQVNSLRCNVTILTNFLKACKNIVLTDRAMLDYNWYLNSKEQNRQFFQIFMGNISFTCSNLELLHISLDMIINYQQTNNLKLHHVQHLLIKGAFEENDEVDLSHDIEMFAQFIANNFPNLKTWHVFFSSGNHSRRVRSWEWTNSQYTNGNGVLKYHFRPRDDEENCQFFQTFMNTIPFTCSKLEFLHVTLDMIVNCQKTNNLKLHQIQHLQIKGSFKDKEEVELYYDVEALANFINENFPNLKTLKVYFSCADLRGKSWNWRDSQLSMALATLPSTVNGDVNFDKVGKGFQNVDLKKFPTVKKMNAVYFQKCTVHRGLNFLRRVRSGT